MAFKSSCSIDRYYDPTTDSFISVDPEVQQTDQPYAFVNDNPLNATDPLGLHLVGPNEQSAFESTTAHRSSTTKTLTFISGSKPVSVSISSSPVTIPLGGGFTATVTASASISLAGQKTTPTLNVGSDGSVAVTANGVTGSVAGSGGNTFVSLSSAVAGTSSQLFIGGDKVAASIGVSIGYSPQSGGWNLTFSEIEEFLAFPLSIASDSIEGCVEDLPGCVGRLAPAT